MPPARRFTIALVVVCLTVGIIRSLVVAWLFHLAPATGVRVAVGQIGIACIWIPVGLMTLHIWERSTTQRARYLSIGLLGIAVLFAEPALLPYLGAVGAHPAPYWRRFIGRADTNFLFYLTVIGAAAAVNARVRQLAAELTAARLETAVADAQLHVLTLQLQPHFLFNALNLVSQLAYENVVAARRTIANLRSLLVESLRYALHREVSLEEELGFLRAYLEIQEARFSGRLFSTVCVEPGVERAAVPHLLLQPLVENAIVHGLAHREETGHVEIAVSRKDERLILTVRDDGVGLPKLRRERLGLTNTRLRLEQLFPNDHRLTLSPGEARGAVVTVDIPFRAAPERLSPSDDLLESPLGVLTSEEPLPFVRRRRVGTWLPVIAAWSAIALVWTELRAINERGSEWSTLFVSGVVNAGLWMVMTPFVIAFVRWADVAGPRSRRFIAAHAAGAVIVGVFHTSLWLAVLFIMRSSDVQPIMRSVFGWMIWDAVAYVTIVAITTFATLASRIRDARVAMSEQRARLSEARVASLRLRLQPHVLLDALDALERVVSIDATRSEAAITRMGDLLRLLLARAEQEWADVDEEVELLAAFLDVVNAWRAPHASHASVVSANRCDGQIPTMLLPTLAQAIGGDLDAIQVGDVNDRTLIYFSSRRDVLDAQTFRQISQRLAQLYHGRERLVSGRLDGGGRFIRVELPLTSAPSITLDGAQRLATA